MVPYLLNILEGRLDSIDNPATTKAQIVKALKAMTRSLLLGDKVNAILEKSSVWAEYKDQKHDLFISNTPTAGYLTGKLTLVRSSFSDDVLLCINKHKLHSWNSRICRIFDRWT